MSMSRLLLDLKASAIKVNVGHNNILDTDNKTSDLLHSGLIVDVCTVKNT